MNASAGSNVSVYDEIVVHIPALPPGQHLRTPAEEEDPISVYNLWFYGKCMLPAQLRVVGRFDPSRKPPLHMGGLPLIGGGELPIRWKNYPDYREILLAFSQGSRGEDTLLSLQSLFPIETANRSEQMDRVAAEGRRPLRTWLSNEAIELEDIPWEPIVLGRRGGASRLAR